MADVEELLAGWAVSALQIKAPVVGVVYSNHVASYG
jgi:hypothetical protein